MLLISSRLHGILDYVVGVALIAAPWVLGFADKGPATVTPVVIGALIIGMSLITNYEYSIAKIIPLTTHLMADVLAAGFLAVSPWLLGFDDYVYVPHLIVGLAVLLESLMTVRTLPRHQSDTYWIDSTGLTHSV